MKDDEGRAFEVDAQQRAAQKVEGQQAFENSGPINFVIAVGRFFEAVADVIDGKLGSAHEGGLFADVALHYGNGIMQAEAHTECEKNREEHQKFDEALPPGAGVELALHVAHVVDTRDTDPPEQKPAEPAGVEADEVDGEHEGYAEHARHEDHHEDAATQQVTGGLHFLAQGEVAAPYGGQHFFGRFGPALHPAVLLAFKAVHLGGQLGGAAQFFQVLDTPALQLRADTEVEVFGERIGFPAARVGDGGPSPHPRRAVELQQVVARLAALLLHREMHIELERLQARDEAVIFVDVLPARLHHAHLFVPKMGDSAAQKIEPGQKIGVENGDELAACLRGGRLECPGLVARAVGAVVQADIEAPGAIRGHLGARHCHGLVGAVVEHLYFQAVLRVVQLTDTIDEPVHHVALVENGQLHGDHRPGSGGIQVCDDGHNGRFGPTVVI